MSVSLLATSAFSLSAATVLTSQPTEFGVFAEHTFHQTSSSGAVADANPYAFGAFVTGISLSTAPSYRIGLGSSTTLANQNVGTPSTSWGYFPTAYSSQSALSSANANGNYTFTIGGTMQSTLAFSSSSFPATTPSITGGNWANNTLLISPSGTISFTAPTFTFGTGDFVQLTVSDGSGNDVLFYRNYSSISSITLNTSGMTGGQTYSAELLFVDASGTVSGLGSGNTSATGFAAAGNMTSFNIMVVPEPSTYALMGLGVVGLLMWRRRTVTA